MAERKPWLCADEQKTNDGLWEATPDCPGEIRSAPGGGVKCDTCRGWFCF